MTQNLELGTRNRAKQLPRGTSPVIIPQEGTSYSEVVALWQHQFHPSSVTADLVYRDFQTAPEIVRMALPFVTKS